MAHDTENRLITAFQKQAEKINYFCSAENISPNLAIHEIRKSFKRIRALLEFYSECQFDFPQKLKNDLKYYGKILSPVRESFINIQIFERVTSGNNLIPERKIKQVKEIISEKNRLLVVNQFIEKDIIENILQLINTIENRFKLFISECPSLKQIESQLSDSFLKCFELHQQLYPEVSCEKLHKLRKNLKRLWYQFDFIKFMHPRYFRLNSDKLNRITEQLGDDHDLCVFSQELKSEEYKFSTEELMILEKQLEHLRDLNMLKLSPRMKQFFNEPPEIFDRKLEKIFKIA